MPAPTQCARADNATADASLVRLCVRVSLVHAASRTARELTRISKAGGTVFLGQLNDPDLRRSSRSRKSKMEGGRGVPPHYWYKFALEEGLDVQVARGEEVCSCLWVGVGVGGWV